MASALQSGGGRGLTNFKVDTSKMEDVLPTKINGYPRKYGIIAQRLQKNLLPQARAVSFVALPQGLHLVQFRLLCP